MKHYLIPFLALCLIAAAPSRQKTYTAGQIISPSDVTENEDAIFNYLQAGVDTYKAASIAAVAIQTGTITNTQIQSGTITAAELGASSVGASEITDDSILKAEFGDEDWGDLTVSSNSITLDANVVANAEMADDAIGTAEMADADHGDFTWSGGVGTIDASVIDSANFADEDWGDMTVSSNSVTLDSGVVAAAELAATLTMSDGDFLDFSASNASTTTDGMRLPQNTDCSAATAEGQPCWDTDDDELRMGDGSASVLVGGGAWIFVETLTGSESSAILASATLPTDSGMFMLVFERFRANASVGMQINTDANLNYDVFQHDGGSATSQVTFEILSVADSNSIAYGVMYIWRVDSAADDIAFRSMFFQSNDISGVSSIVYGHNDNIATMTSFRFLDQAGNANTLFGKIHIYKLGASTG